MNIKQIYKQYGLTPVAIQALVADGTLPSGGISEVDMGSLVEGRDYVVCQNCLKWVTEVTTVHLRGCSGGTRAQYLAQHPGVPWRTTRAESRKAKTPEQRQAQSEKLKARFKTPEGEETRRQISEAAKKLQAGEYGAVAAQHLRQLNSQPEQRIALSIKSKAMWGRSSHRAKVAAWREENRDKVLSTAANARRHIHKHFTKPHAAIKEALLGAGLVGFVTEHPVGWYSIDEARVDLKLAVEVDGCWWHGCVVCGHPGVGSIKHTDARKSTYLKNKGWTILRLPEHDVKANLDGCINKVREVVEKLSRGAA